MYNKFNLSKEEREKLIDKCMEFYGTKWNRKTLNSLTDIQLQEMGNHMDMLKSEGRSIQK